VSTAKIRVEYTDQGHAILPTGRAAELLGVSQQTVIRWIDRGLLPGFRIPNQNGGGTGFRRVKVNDLLRFSAPYPDMHERVREGLEKHDVVIDKDFTREPLTTGEAAKIFRVACKTVSNWCDEGKLRSYRIPYSKDRRITIRSIIEFANEHQFPLREILADLGLGGGRVEEETGRLVMKVTKGEKMVIDGCIEIEFDAPVRNIGVVVTAPKSIPIERATA
jgi:DNA-binding transcriptional MerR regulator